MVTGTDEVRNALRVRIKKGHVATLARDLGVGIATLDAFAHGSGKLPPATIEGLARVFFGTNLSFDIERDLLVRHKSPVTSIVAPLPEPYVGKPFVRPTGPLNTGPPPPPKGPRPGWSE